jgi:DMSO reductase iron-sulfur subunit
MPRGFFLDLNACTGCGACRLACTLENGLAWGRSWRQVSTYNEERHPEAPTFHLSLACNHCAEAPCMEQCPALAIRRETATGAVLIEASRCIGCRYCGWACPYDAPLFDEEQGVMGKCTFCGPRLEEGREPACAALCPTGALRSGELERLGGVESVEGFPPRPLGPSLRLRPLREGRSAPEIPRSAAPLSPALPRPRAGPARASLATEWPLAVFTLMATFLASALAASLDGALRLSGPAFLAGALLAMGVSALHLGRRERAWRALLNLRRSWLSREIALFSLFAALGTLFLLAAPQSSLLGRIASLAGFATLFTIDRVYDLAVERSPVPLHSADTLLGGVLLTGALLGNPWLAGPAALVVLTLYFSRRWRRGEGWTGGPGALAAARIGVGLILPALLWAAPGAPRWAMLLALGAGLVVDRLELYLEIDIPTPRRELAAALERRLDAREATPRAGTSSATSSPSW